MKTLIAQEQYTQAQVIINELLQQDPQNIDVLLLEASIIGKTETASDALAYYYELLDMPLTEAQRTNLIKIINSTAQRNIAELKSLAAWDVLSDFLEPLWQFDPQNVNYIISLAEAYARQKLAAPMENVLASLPPGDRRIEQIRRLLNLDESEQNTATILPQSLISAPSVELSPYGSHYLVDTLLNRERVNLMLDTGASTTAVSASVLRRLQSSSGKVRFIGRYQVNTAGGRIMARVYELSRLSIGEKTVNNVAVLVLPDRNLSPADGLLGMNVLSKFNFHIDQQESRLYLSERP